MTLKDALSPERIRTPPSLLGPSMDHWYIICAALMPQGCIPTTLY